MKQFSNRPLGREHERQAKQRARRAKREERRRVKKDEVASTGDDPQVTVDRSIVVTEDASVRSSPGGEPFGKAVIPGRGVTAMAPPTAPARPPL